MSVFKKETHSLLYFFGLLVLVCGLPYSNVLVSISLFILAGNWFIEGNFKNKLYRLIKNKAALVLCSIIIIYCLGLIHTENFSYALKDLRIKVPLFILAFIISSSEKISKTKFDILMIFFIAAVFLVSLSNTYRLIFSSHTDIREISQISHIRFALLLCLSIFSLIYFIINDIYKLKYKLVFLAGCIWLITYLFMTASFTGIIILIVCGLVLLIYFGVKNKKKIFKLIYLASFLFISFILFIYLNNVIKGYYKSDETDFSKLEYSTERGNLYHNDTLNTLRVNGNYVWLYLSDKELKDSWNKRSSIIFDDNSKSGDAIRDILIRFLTSKGLRKDAKV